jgi:chromosomal replication initiator protein
MDVQDMEIESAVRAALTKQVGAEQLRLWLPHEQALTCVQGGLIVRAADAFTLERLRRKLRPVLQEVMQQVTGKSAEIQFQLDVSLKRQTSASIARTKTIKADPNQRYFPFAEELEQVALDEQATIGQDSLASTNPVVSVATLSAATNMLREPAKSREQEKSTGRKFAALESFVVGPENRLAYTAAESLHGRLGAVSPLYLYGPTGTGKTHLLEGIWSSVRRRQPHSRCLYLAAEQFTSLFLEALQGKGIPSFRRKYREVDLLIIDGIQFFSGKKATMQELLAALDYFSSEHRQLVLSADSHPGQISEMPEELVSRITSGLVLNVEPAGEELKRRLLTSFLKQAVHVFSPDVFELLATELPGDARVIRGAVNRLLAWHEVTRERPTVKSVRETCRDLFLTNQRMIHLCDIEKAICEVFRISAKSLQSAAKSRLISQPRMLALWLSRKYTRAGLTEIGQHFGLKSHSTVIAAHKKVEGWLNTQESIRLDHQTCSVKDALLRVEHALRTTG